MGNGHTDTTDKKKEKRKETGQKKKIGSKYTIQKRGFEILKLVFCTFPLFFSNTPQTCIFKAHSAREKQRKEHEMKKT